MVDQCPFYTLAGEKPVFPGLTTMAYSAVDTGKPDLFVPPKFLAWLKPTGEHRLATTMFCGAGEVADIPSLPLSHYSGVETDDVTSCGVAGLVREGHKLLVHSTNPRELQALVAYGLFLMGEGGVSLGETLDFLLHTNSAVGYSGQRNPREDGGHFPNYLTGEGSYQTLLARVCEELGLPHSIKPVDVRQDTVIKI